MPVLATQHTPAGAAAFAKFFVETIDWGVATISGAYMRHLADARCTSCASLADGFDSDRRMGDRYIGGRISIRANKTAASPPTPSFKVTFDAQSFETLDAHGHLVTGQVARKGSIFFVVLRWQNVSWFVSRLEVSR